MRSIYGERWVCDAVLVSLGTDQGVNFGKLFNSVFFLNLYKVEIQSNLVLTLCFDHLNVKLYLRVYITRLNVAQH